MKKLYSSFIALWLISSLALAQSFENMPFNEYLCNDKRHNIKECVNPLVDRIDVYLRDPESNRWIKDQTFYYKYNTFQNLTEINVFDYQDSIFSQRYLYEYYSNQLLMKRSLQYFVNGALAGQCPVLLYL